MKQYKALHLILIGFLFSLVGAQFMSQKLMRCFEGERILTRLKKAGGGYTLGHKCVCPIDFMGEQCLQHRQVRCYLTKRGMDPIQIDSTSFRETMNIELQVNVECYIQQSQTKYVRVPQFIISRQLQPSKLLYSLENLAEGEEPVWANKTSLFDQHGFLLYIDGYNYTQDPTGRKVMSPQDEQAILYGNGPPRFHYQGNFLGVPMTKSNFYVIPKIIRPTRNRIPYNKLPLQIQNAADYSKWIEETSSQQKLNKLVEDITLQDIIDDPSKLNQKFLEVAPRLKELTQDKVQPYFKTSVAVSVREAAEFHTVRIQIAILELYREDLYILQTGVNAVQFFVPVKVEGVGDATVYSINFNQKDLPRYVYVLGGVFLAGAIYLVYGWRQRRAREKDNKIKQDIQEMEEDISWK